MIPAIKYVLDTRRTNNNIKRVYITLSIKGRNIRYSAKIKVHQDHWKGKPPNWVSPKDPNNHHLNAFLNNRLNYLLSNLTIRFDEHGIITINDVRQIWNEKFSNSTFNEFYKLHVMPLIRKTKALATYKKYKTFLDKLNTFNPDIPFTALQYDLFDSFAIDLQTNHNNSPNTIHKQFECFKVGVREAVRLKRLKTDPFDHYTIKAKKTKSNIDRLTIMEINKIKHLKFDQSEKHLQRTRDQFLFLIFTAGYANDLQMMKWSGVQTVLNKLVFKGNRYKNDEVYTAPLYLFPTAKEILDIQNGKHKELIWPETISNQKFNDQLKIIIAKAEIDKKVSSKTARHTISDLYLQIGFNKQHAMQFTGHKQESSFDSYTNPKLEHALKISNDLQIDKIAI